MSESNRQIYAHSKNGYPCEEWQLLSDHLSSVANMAGAFARSFQAEEWAFLAGLVHDAGKASEAFQRRLNGSSEQVDHATAGAQMLVNRYGDIGRMLAYIVAGHHGGLANNMRSETGGGHVELTPLKERLAKQVEPFDDFYGLVSLPTAASIRSAAPLFLKRNMMQSQRAYSLCFLVKMLFSCVTDADYLDTERALDFDKYLKRRYTGMSLAAMNDALNQHVAGLSKKTSKGNPGVLKARAEISDVCLKAASGKPGVYSLTVPTGGGKTLSSLIFALNHAMANDQRRVIYAAPYTTILDQTASVFRGIFGVDSVIEHHSNFDFSDFEYDDEIALQQRLAMENWDAPLIVTTNVQLFESMHSAKPSRSRKLHNIANSVLILDEVQSLPDSLLRPCLAGIEELAMHYGTTVVLCTATQPALDAQWPFESHPIEIVPQAFRHEDLFSRRAKIKRLCGSRSAQVELEELVNRLDGHDQVLCIVGSRKAAAILYDSLVRLKGRCHVYHLSASMVPEHRKAVLAQIRSDLHSGEPCTVVSTQLIEAGVDIDFPVVYRELAGIDSVKQAAGRCNREGKRESGMVFVFDCPELAFVRRGWLARMRALGKETVETSEDPFGEAGVQSFFAKRYSVEDTDAKAIFSSMSSVQRAKRCNWEFERYSRDFQFVEGGMVDVVVPWGERGMELLGRLRSADTDITLTRDAQRYSVSIPFYQFSELEKQNLSKIGPFNVLEPFNGELVNYSDEKGLVISGDNLAMLMV